MKKRRKKKNKHLQNPKKKVPDRLPPEAPRSGIIQAMHARHGGKAKNTRMKDKRDSRESGKNETRDLKDEAKDES